jgi:hypothetical protein
MPVSGSVLHHQTMPTVAATATKVANARDQRFLVIQNQGATDVWLGGPGVTITSGFLLKGGQTPPASFVDAASVAEWWAITAAGGYTGLFIDEIY